MLHGFLGSGRNWATIARRLVDLEEGWGGVLIDLRLHGRSTGFSPPHTVEAAAADLEGLTAELGAEPEAVLGQSAQRIYPCLSNLGSIASQIHEEATVDRLRAHLAELRASRAETDVDQRARVGR